MSGWPSDILSRGASPLPWLSKLGAVGFVLIALGRALDPGKE